MVYFNKIPVKRAGLKVMVKNTDEKKRSILVVDDELGNRRLYCEILSDLGYNVIDGPDGAFALSVIREGTEIDLVITDYRMPDMNGLELVMALRQVLPSVPVIMITAYASIENYFQSMNLGVFEYVNKPVAKREFERVVQKALHETGASAA